VVFDGADGGFFPDVNMNVPALGGLLSFHPDIFKVPAVPNGTQIPLQGIFVVNVAYAGINAGFYVSVGIRRFPWTSIVSISGHPGAPRVRQERVSTEADKDQRQRPYPGGNLRLVSSKTTLYGYPQNKLEHTLGKTQIIRELSLKRHLDMYVSLETV